MLSERVGRGESCTCDRLVMLGFRVHYVGNGGFRDSRKDVVLHAVIDMFERSSVLLRSSVA